MSRSLNMLNDDFRPEVKKLLLACEKSGYPMRPYCTLRTPFEQAKLWRQSRTIQEIERQISTLKNYGGDFLAHCIETVGPQYGKHVTNARPGFSWHQWGEALDCFWLINGNSEWSTRRKTGWINGYKNYAEKAAQLGLTNGGRWIGIADYNHVQSRGIISPSRIYSIREINDEMENRFG